MKATKVSRDRTNSHESEDSLRRAAKLDPVKKNGKERHLFYDRDDDDPELYPLKKQRSILDYYDDGEGPAEDEWEDNEDDDDLCDDEEEQEEE